MPLTKSKSAGSRKARAKTKVVDAIKLLKQDHREVEGYFEDYEEAKDADAKAALSAKICLALKVHTQIEEELFYRPRGERPETTTFLTKPSWSIKERNS